MDVAHTQLLLAGGLGLCLGLTLGLAVALKLLGSALRRRDQQVEQLIEQARADRGHCWVRSQLPPHADR